jgi:hypothetical protein
MMRCFGGPPLYHGLVRSPGVEVSLLRFVEYRTSLQQTHKEQQWTTTRAILFVYARRENSTVPTYLNLYTLGNSGESVSRFQV